MHDSHSKVEGRNLWSETPQSTRGGALAVVALVFGILSVCGWLGEYYLWYCGLPRYGAAAWVLLFGCLVFSLLVSPVGTVLGIIAASRQRARRLAAVIGLILSAIVLAAHSFYVLCLLHFAA
jgi:hypothetical protein